MRALADVARTLDLGEYLLLGRGEESTGGRDKASILADTMEAVIGTVYLSTGLDAAATFVHHLLDPLMRSSATLGAGLDWKTSLQELAASASLGVPEYRVTEEGPDHEKVFHAHGGRRRRGARRGRSVAARRRPSRRPPRSRGPSSPAAPTPSSSPRSTRRLPASRLPTARMPELPEVEVVRRGLQDHVVGRRIASAQFLGSRVARRHVPGPADLAARLTGNAVLAAERRGKYLWLVLEAPDAHRQALIIHLGMSGQLLVEAADAPAQKHLHARFDFEDDGPELRFVDQRTFGGMALADLVPDVAAAVPEGPVAGVCPRASPTSPPTRSSRASTGPASWRG